MIRYSIIWGNRAGSDCGSSLTAEMNDGCFLNTVGNFDSS